MIHNFFFLNPFRQQSVPPRNVTHDDDSQTKRMRLPSGQSSEYNKVVSPSHCQGECNCERCDRVTVIDLE